MNRFSYRIHYRNEPGRIGNIPMDSEQVFAALCRFRDSLPEYMEKIESQAVTEVPLARHESAMRIVVHTNLDWQKATLAMAAYADRHGLSATHVASALVPVRPPPMTPARRIPFALVAR